MKSVRIPGPDHPITVEATGGRVVVKSHGKIVADSVRALTLRESDYPPVQYIPREDVDPAMLERTDHATYCPYKGDCSYFDLVVEGSRAENAVWTYENPYPAVADIRNHLAFYPERVDSVEVVPSAV